MDDKKQQRDSDPSDMTDFEKNATSEELRDALPSKDSASIPGKPMSDMAPAGQDEAEETV